jgi:hypothetical protein
MNNPTTRPNQSSATPTALPGAAPQADNAALPNAFTNAAPDQPAALPGFGIGTTTKKSISLHTVLLVLVVAISAVAIFGMRKIGVFTGNALAATTTVDMATVPKIDTRHLQVIAELNRNRVENQVPETSVQKNPFVLSLRPAKRDDEPKAARPGASPEEIAAANAALRDAEARKSLEALTLNGIMGGTTPVARINGRLFRVGDKLPGGSMLSAIEGRRIIVEVNNEFFAIDLGQ